MNVSLVATSDRRLHDWLRACGAQVTVLTMEDLADLAHASALQPDLIVIDQRHRNSVPAALAAIKRQHPSTGILMVLARLDAALMLEAMRAGVSECVAEPFTQEDLQAAIGRIAAHRPASRRGDVFAVVGAKGGVGATTVAVNLATMLAKLRPSSTLLIDLHRTYGDAAVFLSAEPRFSIVDALENMHRMDATFLRSLVAQTKSGLQLLASSDHPVSAPADATQVRALIELAAAEFPYVVLDVPRSDAAILDSLEPAGTIVVVANQEVATVRSAGRMASALQQRYGKERVTVVITRYHDGAEINQKDVERVVGRPVTYVFPNNYPIALASLNKGRPLVLDNHNKLASAFTSFARSLAGIPAERSGSDKSSGLLSLIGGRRR
jgi:pilus assembly protein CpaE